MSTRRATRQPSIQDAPSLPAGGARVRVRLKDSGPERRYRAGLGPFVRQWVELSDVPERVVEALRADPLLVVEEVA